MRLSQLLKRDLARDPEITGVTADSRRVKPGYLFAALPGAKADGRAFVEAALGAGAVAVLSSGPIEELAAPVVESADPRRDYALAAAAFWGAQPKTCVAVTGTNGKTSVATFCRQIFAHRGHAAASMGTLGVQVSRPGAQDIAVTPPGLTTPDAADVAEMLARLAGEGVTHMAMEASSHGIDQRRLDGVALAAAGFTNLTQDHLDYHGDMAAYRDAKLRLFGALLPRGAAAVLNADSDAFEAFAATASSAGQTILSVGRAGQALRLVDRTPTPEGQRLKIEADGRVHDILLPLAGAFQADNALVAAGLAIAVGEPIEAVLEALQTLKGAPGRLQRVGSGPKGGEAYVDYAHTPDGLQTVLTALRPHTAGRLIVVFGAGGDRDKTKRPIMGAIAARLADVSIVTDDNPRSEDPIAIRDQIVAGFEAEASGLGRDRTSPTVVEDRAMAIRLAAQLLSEGDVLVVAGKGHEQGQTIAGVVHPFDDVAVTAEALR